MTDITKYLALQTALVNEKAMLEARLGEISKVLGADVVVAAAPSPATTTTPGKRTLREATKAKMRAAHQARWAKVRAKSGAVPAPVAAPAAPKKRKLSAQGRANIIAATKARWAKVKALKAKSAK